MRGLGYVEVRRTVVGDLQIGRIARHLRTTENEVLGALVRLWIRVADGESGHSKIVDLNEAWHVDDAAQLEGMHAALSLFGWVYSRALSARATSDLEAVVAAWNDLPRPFPKVRSLNAARTKKLRTRLGDAVWSESWAAAIERIPTIPGLRGENDRGWIANIEWFIQPNTVDKLLEGYYDRWGKAPIKPKRKEWAGDDGWMDMGLSGRKKEEVTEDDSDTCEPSGGDGSVRLSV